jgi:hypothetical protein
MLRNMSRPSCRSLMAAAWSLADPRTFPIMVRVLAWPCWSPRWRNSSTAFRRSRIAAACLPSNPRTSPRHARATACPRRSPNPVQRQPLRQVRQPRRRLDPPDHQRNSGFGRRITVRQERRTRTSITAPPDSGSVNAAGRQRPRTGRRRESCLAPTAPPLCRARELSDDPRAVGGISARGRRNGSGGGVAGGPAALSDEGSWSGLGAAGRRRARRELRAGVPARSPRL